MQALVLWFGGVMFILGRELLLRRLNLFLYILFLNGIFYHPHSESPHPWIEKAFMVSLHTFRRWVVSLMALDIYRR